MPREEKVKALEEIKNSLNGASGIVLADFKGVSVASLDKLRTNVINDGGVSKVVKNKLLKKALEEVNMNGMDPYLKENTIMFSSKEDILKVLKALADFSKENDKFVIKAGYLDGQVFDKAGIIAMSKLPSRKELIGMVAGGINSVLASFVGTLNGVMTTFVGTVEALEKKKEQEGK